ncbi:MAG: hypothetical protein NXI10_01200 [bacterium]|nr:hypothetical protein [bacterium]
MRVLSKVIVFFWVTTILVASTCFGADVHYCKGEAQSFNIYDVAKPCNMHKKKLVEVEDDNLPPCCKAKKKAEVKPQEGVPVAKNGKCCYNDQVGFKTDLEQHHATPDLASLELNKSAAILQQNQTLAWSQEEIVNMSFRGPPDPDIRRNYQTFFQVFLI